jgi:hypothetical protein
MFPYLYVFFDILYVIEFSDPRYIKKVVLELFPGPKKKFFISFYFVDFQRKKEGFNS